MGRIAATFPATSAALRQFGTSKNPWNGSPHLPQSCCMAPGTPTQKLKIEKKTEAKKGKVEKLCSPKFFGGPMGTRSCWTALVYLVTAVVNFLEIAAAAYAPSLAECFPAEKSVPASMIACPESSLKSARLPARPACGARRVFRQRPKMLPAARCSILFSSWPPHLLRSVAELTRHQHIVSEAACPCCLSDDPASFAPAQTLAIYS